MTIATTSTSIEPVFQIKELILKIAKPDIYCDNAFQQLSLPVTASLRELQKRRQIIEIGLKTGASIPKGAFTTIVLKKIQDSYVLEETIQRLRNPEERLLDEIFWFWLDPIVSTGLHDPVLDLLTNGKIAEALNFWSKRVAVDSQDGIALHNLAIFTHVQILENENLLLLGKTPAFDQKRLNDGWNNTYQYWKMLIDHEGFWSRVTDRIRQLDDPRLTTGSARRIRSLLPLCLLVIQARLAKEFLENDKPSEAARHIDLIRGSGFDNTTIQEACQEAVASTRKRLKQVCQSAEDRIEADPIHAIEAVTALLNQSDPILKAIDPFAGASKIDHEMHDLVAITGKAGVLAYSTKTEQHQECKEMLEQLLRIAGSQAERARINQLISRVTDNLKDAHIFHGKGYYELPKSILEILEQAWNYVEQEDWKKSVETIEALLTKSTSEASAINVDLVNIALAYCLNGLANQEFQEYIIIIDTPRQVITNTFSRYKTHERQIGLAGWAFENGRLNQAAYEGVLFCMACGRRIYPQQWVTMKYKEVTLVICQFCNNQDDIEIDRRKTKVQSILKRCGVLMIRARSLNYLNQTIINNLVGLRKTALEWGVPIPPDPQPANSEVFTQTPTSERQERILFPSGQVAHQRRPQILPIRNNIITARQVPL